MKKVNTDRMSRFTTFMFVLSVVLMAGTPVILNAGHVPTTGGSTGSGEGGETPPCDSCPVSCSPVEFRRGAEKFVFEDLVSYSLTELNLIRQYDSRSSYDSPLGFGWSHAFEVRVYPYTDGSVTLRRACGERQKFVYTAGAYVSPPAVSGELTRTVSGGWAFTEKSGSVKTFDDTGKLIQVSDSVGNRTVLSYDTRGRLPLMGVSQYALTQNPQIVSYDFRLLNVSEYNATGVATGRQLSFSYDEITGRLVQVSDDGSRSVTYRHDANGNLVEVTDANNVVWAYGYTDPADKHNLTDVPGSACANCGAANAKVTNTYDSKDRVISQVRGLHATTFVYDDVSKTTTMTETVKDAGGVTLRNVANKYTTGANGYFPSVIIDGSGNTTSITYDSRANETQRSVYQSGVGTLTTTTKTYDARDNVLTVKEASNSSAIARTTTYTYTPTNKVASVATKSVVNVAATKTTTYIYNAVDLVETAIEQGLNADGTSYTFTTKYTYDTNGRPRTIDGPRADVNDVVTFTHDARGQLTQIDYPNGKSQAFSNFTAAGLPQTVVDTNGVSIALTYDNFNRALSQSIGSDATSFTYTADGKLASVTSPKGTTTQMTYDALGNRTAVRDALNNVVQMSYDSADNLIKTDIKDPANVLQLTRSYVYDERNKLKRSVNPDAGATYFEYLYDALGNRTSARDALGNITTTTYDALSRPTRITQPGTINTVLAYDLQDNLTQVTAANGAVTQYQYDDRDLRTRETSPDRGTTNYRYDASGNLTSLTDAKGTTITRQYDALNRLTRIDYPSDPDVVLSYDSCVNGANKLCSVTDAHGSTSHEYTTKGQRSKDTRTLLSKTFTTQYAYDANGNRTVLTLPSGRTVTATLNAADQITQLSTTSGAGTQTLVQNIQYKPFGGISSYTLGNALNATIGYDNQYRTTTIQTGALQNKNYTLDANGNITAITDVLNAAKNKTYSYDALHRLQTATGSTGSYTWTYDGAGNRKTQVKGTDTDTYTIQTNSNRLTAISGGSTRSFGYDANGNRITDNTTTTSYNDAQRLTQVTTASGTATYGYNAQHQRILKTQAGITTGYLYDLDDNLIAETDGSGTLKTEYIYLYQTPLAKIDVATNTITYIHSDHLATPQLMTNSSGSQVWSIETGAFGDSAALTGTATNNLRFPGQYADSESGLSYNWNRYYDSSVGRYVGVDPIGLSGGINTYAYVDNNPLSFIDLLGLECGPFDEFNDDDSESTESDSWDLTITDGLLIIYDIVAGDGGVGAVAGIVAKKAAKEAAKKEARKEAAQQAQQKLMDKTHRGNQQAKNHDTHTNPRSGRLTEKKRLEKNWKQRN